MARIDQRIERFDNHLLLKNFSIQTRTSYIRTLREFDKFRNENGIRGRYGQGQAKSYLLTRIKAGKSWSTINGSPSAERGSYRFKVHRTLPGCRRIAQESALRKYFREVANLSWNIKKVPRPRKEDRLPEILSKEDVQKIIEHAVI